MGLVVAVLATASGPGYLIEDTAAGSRVWRASGAVDPRRELATLERAAGDEAAMVTQLLERGWLRRTARAPDPLRRGARKSSGRRRFPVEAHAVAAPTPT